MLIRLCKRQDLTPDFIINDPHLEPRLAPQPAEDVRFFQAMLEGMARIEAAAYRLLEQLGTPRVEEVLSIGGGAGNEPWELR